MQHDPRPPPQGARLPDGGQPGKARRDRSVAAPASPARPAGVRVTALPDAWRNNPPDRGSSAGPAAPDLPRAPPVVSRGMVGGTAFRRL
jgi:hypothetical protein